MKDYDVIVIGGGINGLTAAAYLAKAGKKVGVFEARGQCGAHCDTIELGLAGFLHNLHATWIVPALSPAMVDLDLTGFGLDLRGTDVLFAKSFLDGRNVVQALDQTITQRSLERVSERDAAMQGRLLEYLMEHAVDSLELNQKLLFGAPSAALMSRLASFQDGLCAHAGLRLTGDDLQRMNGFEVLEVLYESEHARTLSAALGEYTQQLPIHRRTGALAITLAALAPVPVHTARGGSHALTHSLVKAVVAAGGDVWTACPVDKIRIEGGRAHGVRLSADALFPLEEIHAGVVVSNLSLVPTFLRLLGEGVIGVDRARQIRGFNYDDLQLVSVYYALRGDPEFRSAAYDPEVQRSWLGYFGGETLREMRNAQADVVSGVLPDEIVAGWFIPTRADPSQAPSGCHTAYAWISAPPCPRRWRGRQLDGWDSWRELAEPLADAITELFERHAPGFRDLILERFVATPLDQELNNPSAVLGNIMGGSAMPEQYGVHRPLPGICVGGASRSFIPGLYLSNSIHPYGATHLASGYIAAHEVATDLGCRDAAWWRAEPFVWFLENMFSVPMNAGVPAQWQRPA